MPVKTHSLTQLDVPAEIVKHYVLPHAQKGDIVTIAELPVAIMRGRFIDPTAVKPGFVAKGLCYFFMPTSSLATACGMQSLVDIVGPKRVVCTSAQSHAGSGSAQPASSIYLTDRFSSTAGSPKIFIPILDLGFWIWNLVF